MVYVKFKVVFSGEVSPYMQELYGEYSYKTEPITKAYSSTSGRITIYGATKVVFTALNHSSNSTFGVNFYLGNANTSCSTSSYKYHVYSDPYVQAWRD